jgi:predicted dinucleotide-binding enzyme
MDIGILGAGRLAEALAAPWVAAGHDVVVGGRTPAKAAAVAERTGARAAPSLRAVAEGADVVVLAVLYQGIEATLETAGAADGVLAGKVLVDVNNPVETEDYTVVADWTPSLAEHLAAVTGAEVVKTLHMVGSDVWRTRATFAGAPLWVPVATDSPRARAVAERLIRDAGAEPLDAGGLSQAHNLEAMTAVIIRLLWNGAQPLSAFQLTVGAPAAAA